MASTTQKLIEKGLIAQAPPFLKTNVHYETIVGSHSYGCADTSVLDKVPDFDIYGFAIPPKDYIFPHLQGYIKGFGTAPQDFEQFQKHGVQETPESVPEGVTYEMVLGELKRRDEI